MRLSHAHVRFTVLSRCTFMPLYVCRKGCFCRVFFEWCQPPRRSAGPEIRFSRKKASNTTLQHMHETTPMSDDTHPTEETATPHHTPIQRNPPTATPGRQCKHPYPRGAPAKCASRCMKGDDTSALRTSICFDFVFVSLGPHGPQAAQSYLSVSTTFFHRTMPPPRS